MKKRTQIILAGAALATSFCRPALSDLKIDLRFPTSSHTNDAHQYFITTPGDLSPITIQAWGVVTGTSFVSREEGLQRAIFAIQSSIVNSGLTGSISAAAISTGWNGPGYQSGAASDLSTDGIGDWGCNANTPAVVPGNYIYARSTKVINNDIDWGDANSTGTRNDLTNGEVEHLLGSFTFTPTATPAGSRIKYAPVTVLGGDVTPAVWYEDTNDKTVASPTGAKSPTTGVYGPATPNTALVNAVSIAVSLPVQPYAWLNATNTNNNWSSGSNWYSGNVPTSKSDVYFNQPGSYQVNVDTFAWVNSVTILDGNVDFNVSGSQFNIQQSFTANGHVITKSGTGKLFFIGAGGVPIIDWKDGAVESSYGISTSNFLANPLTIDSGKSLTSIDFSTFSRVTVNTNTSVQTGGRITAAYMTITSGSTLNIDGGNVTCTFTNGSTTTVDGVVNLNSGLMSSYNLGTNGVINFNGGELKATQWLSTDTPAHIHWNGGTLNYDVFDQFYTGARLIPSNLSLSDSTRKLIIAGYLFIQNANISVADADALQVGKSLTMNTGGVLSAIALRTNVFSLTADGRVDIPANGTSTGVSVVNSITQTGTAKIDLHDNDLIVDYNSASTSSYTNVLNLVKSGLAVLGGTGKGITSTEVNNQTLQGAMLAVVDGGVVSGQITSLSGYPVAHPLKSVLVKYTWFGDCNLDGVVDAADYALVDSGFTSGGTLKGWVFGDLDYNGTVDGADYALIDTGFISQSGVLPEPSLLGLSLPLALGLLRRRIGTN